jgi:hypothetical protein
MEKRSMKNIMIAGLAAAGLMLGAGCEKKGGAGTTGGTTGKKTTDAIKGAAKDAANAAGDLAARAKEEAVATAQGLYESASAEFDTLADKVSKSTAPEKAAWEKLVDGVKTQLGEAKTKLEEMRPDNADWKKLSGEFSALMTKIGDSIKSIASQVK